MLRACQNGSGETSGEIVCIKPVYSVCRSVCTDRVSDEFRELIRYSNDPNLACRRSWKFLCDSRAHCLLCYWSEIRTTGYDRAQKLATSLRSSSTSSAGTLALTILLRFPGRFPLLADECYRGFMLLNFQGNPQMFLNLPWKSSISNGIPVILNNESPERGCL